MVFKKVVELLRLPQKLKDEMIHAYTKVCYQRVNRLHHFFNTVEHIDYFETGINVHHQATKYHHDIKRRPHIIGQILVFSVKPLIDRSKTYHSTHHFLSKHVHTINEMFKKIQKCLHPCRE